MFCPSSLLLLCDSCPRDIFLAPGPQREAQERHAAAGCVLRPPEEGVGENFPEAEIHQQTRQEEARQQTGAERLTGTHSLSVTGPVFTKTGLFESIDRGKIKL